MLNLEKELRDEKDRHRSFLQKQGGMVLKNQLEDLQNNINE